MKTILILVIGLFALYIANAQSCLPNGITFSTQAQIENFQKNYPGCIQIQGDVVIDGGNDITNLVGLNVLNSLNGNLWIQSNSARRRSSCTMECLWPAGRYILLSLTGRK
jgi:hypothetical protein